ncbi:MAG: hypothetical protein HYU67_12965 [Flavobacteriia bacterium]|nr:hypothetical protein [Flavobacteriia bacterium]
MVTKIKSLGLIVLFLFLTFSSVSQKKYRFKKDKRTTGKGSLWFYWGYNRTYYSKSDILFNGTGYRFTLQNVTASDNPSNDISTYFNINTFVVPQFNVRVGYYIKPKLSISLGYDHMKYLMDDKNNVLLTGHIDPGVDSLWSGDYDGKMITTDRNHFHYENSNGLNYIRVELMRSLLLYQTKSQWFGLNANIALGTGILFTISDFNFAQNFERYTQSVAGMGLSTHASLRFEFFKHFFIQPELSGGRMSIWKVKLRESDKNAYAKHSFWYFQHNITIGGFFYLKSKQDCKDCPVWQ